MYLTAIFKNHYFIKEQRNEGTNEGKKSQAKPTDKNGISFATFPNCWLESVFRSQHYTEPPGNLCKSAGTLGRPHQPQ